MNALRLAGVPRSALFRMAVIVVLIIVPSVAYFIDTLDLVPVPGLFFWELMHDVQGCLYFAALAFAAVALSWRGFAFTWLAAFIIHLPRTVMYTLSTEALIRNLGFWFLPLSAGAVITLERHWRAAQRQVELDRQQERELYIQQILVAQEEERLRISKEIHDETLQDLLALAYVADAMLKECHEGDGRLGEKAISMRDTSLRVAGELRRISSDLRPSTLDHLGLVPSLRWLSERTGSEAAIPTRLTVSGQPWPLDKQAEIAIFRIVQEALTNVRKHSGATEAWVNLEFKQDVLKLKIGDNGHGFTPRLNTNKLASEGHLGLLGIRERVAALGGSLRLQSRPTMGTVLNLSIPAPALEITASDGTAARR